MNDFARVEDTLEMLKKQKELTLEDVLGLYLDLCEDIEANGQEIDNLKIEKTENLLKNLSRSGRIFLNIIRKHSEEIGQIDTYGRIRKQEEKLSESIARISDQEEKLQASIAQLSGIIDEEQKKRQSYEIPVSYTHLTLPTILLV